MAVDWLFVKKEIPVFKRTVRLRSISTATASSTAFDSAAAFGSATGGDVANSAADNISDERIPIFLAVQLHSHPVLMYALCHLPSNVYVLPALTD